MSRFKILLMAAGLVLFCPFSAKAAEAPVDHIAECAQRDLDEIALVVMSEANAEPMVGKVAVAATVFNRARIFDLSIHEVIHTPNAYSTHWKGTVSQECYDAVEMYIQCPTLFPDDMVYFQQHSFPKWGDEYLQIGAHYFGTVKKQKEKEKGEEKCFSTYMTMEPQVQ